MGHEAQSVGQQGWQLAGDVIVSRWVGTVTLPELEAFLAFADRCIVQIEHPLLIVDNRRAAPGLPEVRKRLVSWARSQAHFAGVAVFGGDVATRAIGTLIINAIALLSRRKSHIVLVADEAAARAWVDERRQQLQTSRAQQA